METNRAWTTVGRRVPRVANGWSACGDYRINGRDVEFVEFGHDDIGDRLGLEIVSQRGLSFILLPLLELDLFLFLFLRACRPFSGLQTFFRILWFPGCPGSPRSSGSPGLSDLPGLQELLGLPGFLVSLVFLATWDSWNPRFSEALGALGALNPWRSSEIIVFF